MARVGASPELFPFRLEAVFAQRGQSLVHRGALVGDHDMVVSRRTFGSGAGVNGRRRQQRHEREEHRYAE